MKIGILTFHFAHNNGAMLQAYGLSHYLRGNGYDAEIIDYRLRHIYQWKEKYTVYSYYKAQREDGYGVIKSLLRTLRYYPNLQYNHDKAWNSFENFMQKYLYKSKRIYSSQLKSAKYDILICGSDQIWNTELTGGFEPTYFLSFSKSARKISYAASSGSTTLDVTNIDIITQCLRQFKAISCRESGLANTISNMLGENVAVVCDPVFLLDKNEWDKIAQESKISVNQPYVLVYSYWEDEYFYEQLFSFVKRSGLSIVKIGIQHKEYLPPKDFPFIKYVDAGPIEFLHLIRNADYVFTNMFHGTALSLIFNKNFSIILPPVRQERLREILDRTKLWCRVIREDSDSIPDTDTIDYDKVNKIITEFKTQSINFLSNAINNIG